MISIGEALETVLSEVRTLEAEKVPLGEADGRILASDVRAPFDVPGFANSQMDGFGVRSTDLADATADAPARLKVLATIAAGRPFAGEVGPGQAVRIMTGAPIPPGVDAVVPIEDSTVDGGAVLLSRGCPAGRFVRLAGEDLRTGETVLERGRFLRPADAGLLASLGFARVDVTRRPRVAILGTGDELVPLGQPLGPGQIHDSNAYTLAAAVREAGGVPERMGIIRDDRKTLKEALDRASACDAVLSTGGVSVGDFDHVKDVMDEIGLQRRFWKVAQKPGKPLTFAVRDRCLYFGLPGNPVAVMVTFLKVARPIVLLLSGTAKLNETLYQIPAGFEFAKKPGRREWLRCHLEKDEEGGLCVLKYPNDGSGILTSMVASDGLVELAEDSLGVEDGQLVDFLPFSEVM